MSDIKNLIKQCFSGTDISKLGIKDSKSINNEGNQKVARGPGKTPHLTTTKHFSTKFWNALEWLFNEEIYNHWLQITFLTKCLKQVVQRPTTANMFHRNIDIEKRFLVDLADLLRTSFANAPAHIKQCLKQDFPKLLQLAKFPNIKYGNKITLR